MDTKSIKIEKISRGRFMVSAAAAGESGDAALSCGLPDGSLAFLISDGMGKGKAAAAESSAVIRKLRTLLKRGIPASKAIKIVNKTMIENPYRGENFATVDLTIIDKKNGVAKFYKMGAATSFVAGRNRVKRLEQPALPVGIISKLKPVAVSVKLRPGDIIVMVSDGITEADRDDLDAKWLEGHLASIGHHIGPKLLSEEIVSMAQKKYQNRETDDLTAVVAIIE